MGNKICSFKLEVNLNTKNILNGTKITRALMLQLADYLNDGYSVSEIFLVIDFEETKKILLTVPISLLGKNCDEYKTATIIEKFLKEHGVLTENEDLTYGFATMLEIEKNHVVINDPYLEFIQAIKLKNSGIKSEPVYFPFGRMCKNHIWLELNLLEIDLLPELAKALDIAGGAN
jgi:hypothetical protein